MKVCFSYCSASDLDCVVSVVVFDVYSIFSVLFGLVSKSSLNVSLGTQ